MSKPDVPEPEYPAAPTEWPYLSKSRLVSYIKNPRHAYYTYVEGIREPQNFYMARGSRVHKAIEGYYENVQTEYDRTGGVFADVKRYLPDDVMLWADFTEPFITNFLLFEQRRRDYCASADGLMSHFPPVSIEEEVWDHEPPVENSPPWMGRADVILHAGSLPDLTTNEGVVVVDFKTGKTPDEKYRDDGIFLEGEYYAMLFEKEYDVAAVAGYYPKADDLVISPLSADRRERIIKTVEELVALGTDMEEWPMNPGPLCKWGPDTDQQSYFYERCENCPWGKEGGPGPTF